MLGLLLIYFVGKAFYDLAGNYEKSQWGFAILGVVSYYGGLFFGAILVAAVIEFNSPGSIDTVNDTLLGAAGIPFGILICWLTYRLLKRNWSKPATTENHSLDSGFINTEAERYSKDER